ncbi:hypothetical protein HID58_020439, partial [Brassica napus]
FLPAERDRSKSFLSHIGYVRSLLGSHKEENLRADDIVRALKCENVSLRQCSLQAVCFIMLGLLVSLCLRSTAFGYRIGFLFGLRADEERPKETTMKKSQEVGGSSKEEEFQPFPMKEIWLWR